MRDNLQLQPNSTWLLVAARAECSPNESFIRDDLGREITFGEFASLAHSVAERLHSWGIGPGVPVAWQLPSWSETLVLMAALCRLGAIQIPLLPIYRRRELEHIVTTTKPTHYVGIEEWRGTNFRELITQVMGDAKSDVTEVWLDQERKLPFSTYRSTTPLPAFERDPNELHWIYHTSGTASFPKGVCHSDHSVIASSRGWVSTGRITKDDVTSLVFPVAHIGGANLLQGSLLVGCSMVVVEHFDDAAIEFMAQTRVTLPGAGQSFFLKYLDIQRQRKYAPLFPAARAFPTGGAPKNPGIHYELKSVMGAGLLSSYGMTECPIISTCDPLEADDKIATTEGTPNPGIQLRIVDDVGGEVSYGTVGEVTVRGAQLFSGYVQKELEVGLIDDEGFFRTGDLGYLDKDGFLTIVGRLKDVIIRKGENISAKEVEDLLFEHPAVRDVAVIGLRDPSVGERTCAVIVLQPGHTEVPVDELTSHLRDAGLMAQKMPELWVETDVLPRNDQGKPLKTELRMKYQDLARP